MGTSPKVVFNFPYDEHDLLYISDHWARLHPQIDRGSFALGLLTDEVRWQLEHSMSGHVQQFITHDDMEAVYVPALEHEIRHVDEDLHESLTELVEAKQRQAEIMKEAWAMVDARMKEVA